MTWHCKQCATEREATIERGRPKTRAFRTGYVAVQMTCGHWASVTKDRTAGLPVGKEAK